MYINNLGHMNKMAAMPIYGKNPSWGAYSIVVEPASVRPFTFSNLNISKTTSPILIKFDLKHH